MRQTKSTELALPLEPAGQPVASAGRTLASPAAILVRGERVLPTVVYDTYWRFATARQQIFFRRVRRDPPPFTTDPILRQYKFTNAYRASDRVSQYLIRNVIHRGDQAPEELFFRILVFKIFNKIETWERLEQALGPLGWRDYSFDAYDGVLSRALADKVPIYSAAYIMPSVRGFGHPRKHQNHLRLVENMIADELPARLADTRTMREAFRLLVSYPSVGDFLAYQWVTDLNYSSLMSHSEMEFVVPGPGARDGIRKCFHHLGGLSESDAIRMVAEAQEEEFNRRGLEFPSLWGRPLQLIDCQNLFCEVDKYARLAHPEVRGISGRTRIKQQYVPSRKRIDYWYPPKWGLNEKLA